MAAVVLDNVSVDFPIYGAHLSLRKALFDRATGGIIRRNETGHHRVVINALRDVSLEIEEGDRLGLIGHNGAGKSTLLRVIAGVYEPVRGQTFVEGRLTPLFDMLPGFDPEDTGYQNIVTSGLLLGMSRREIERRIPEIEEFSELGEYLALPVRTYSAGMVTRLGFSVATAIDPDILLIDEGIGAGDARFAERVAARTHDLIRRSSIMVLASHSDALIAQTCNKAALMDTGRVLAVGPVPEIAEMYARRVHAASHVPAA